MKKRLRVELTRICTEDLILSREEAIKAFQLEKYPNIDTFDQFIVENSYEYEGDTTIRCVGYRDETDQEVTDRLYKEFLHKKEHEQRELEQLARLKAKYEKP